MKKLVLLLSFFSPLFLFSQIDCGVEEICVVEFNAKFNATNGCDWLNEIEDARVICIDILEFPQLQKEYNISIVPTVIILNGGEETKRYLPNIMMQVNATKEEVQEVIDEILIDKF